MENSDLSGIAIIGFAGRFPGATNVDEFWQNLVAGIECISAFTDEELTASGLDTAALRKDPTFVPARGVLKNAEWFDATFFGMNARQAEVTDPQQRLFFEVSWEALERAGYDPERVSGAIGLYAGAGTSTYYLKNLYGRSDLVDQVGERVINMGNEKDYLATYVAYKLNLRGPAINVNTACSTSLVAVCQACQGLLNYQCDIALAGGVFINFPQRSGVHFHEGGIFSRDGHCRPFDAEAQGTVSSDGIGIVVLKRLNQALDDGDQIWAVIKGFGLNNDGSAKIGFTAPSVNGQAEAIAIAQAQADFDPSTISYVEAHGTATPLGDPIEVAALVQAFQLGSVGKNACALGSVKSNIGHVGAAAGVAGLIKAALALKHKMLPPSLHFIAPNPKIDFANSPFFVNSTLKEWNNVPMPRRAGVSSFGLGGTNAHVVLEEAPASRLSSHSRPRQLLVLSAKTESALETATTNLLTHLKANPDVDLADTAFTLQVGRRCFQNRRMLVCGDVTDAITALDPPDPKRVITQQLEVGVRPVAFLFPGQGAQYVNMGADLYANEPVFKEVLDRCADLLLPHLRFDLREVLFPTSGEVKAAENLLNQTRITQPALFAIEYAIASLWISWGLKPTVMIGHSVGEYVAACLAGVFTLEQALEVVAHRAQLMHGLPKGAMVAVRLPEEELLPLLTEKLSIAAVNSTSTCIVSGPFDAVIDLEMLLKKLGVAGRRLETSHAFHSAMMEPMVGSLTKLLSSVNFNKPSIPYISNVTGRWISQSEANDPTYWARHLRQTVRFAEGLGELLKDPQSILLEVGPGQTLSTLAKQHPGKGANRVVVSSFGASTDREVTSFLTALGKLWLAGAQVDWSGFYKRENRLRVTLPTYPFERKRFWIEPLRPFIAEPRGENASARVGAVSLSRANETTAPSVPVSAADESASEIARGAAARSPDDATTRKEHIRAILLTLFEELSGANLADAGPSAKFTEIGLDSLLLIQVSLAIEKRFGIRIAFRQLVQQLTTLDELAEFLDQKLPLDALPLIFQSGKFGALGLLEIESVLSQHPAVSETLVLAQEDEAQDKRVIAYVVPKGPGEPSVSELRSFLSGKLPNYMVPSSFITLDRLPLSVNGRLNREPPHGSDLAQPELEKAVFAPRTPTAAITRIPLMNGTIASPEQQTPGSPLLTSAERQQVLEVRNTALTDEEKGIHDLFEARAKRAPQATAMIQGWEKLTYEIIDQSANDLTDQLRARGLRSGQIVAFSLPRGPRAVSTMLAIMRCGCAFLPIDVKLPAFRRDQILQIATVGLMVTTDGITELPVRGSPSVDRGVPENTACVLFTSATAGVAKGVCVPHRALVRLVRDVDSVRLDSETRFLHLAPLSSDACLLEIWGPLLNGGTIVVHQDDWPDLSELGYTIAAHGVTTAQFTASLFNHIIDVNPEILRPVRELLIGDEALSVSHAVRALASLPETTLINGYGSAEAATLATAFKIPRDFDAKATRVPIGRPFPSTQVYVLDEHREPQAPGVPGEIYIGGSGVALGYLGDPDLTRIKFVPDKFSRRAGALLYRTGDFGCLLADGNLDFLGRQDDQVKIDGFRIELAELEFVLRQHPAVGDAIVLAQQDNARGQRLVAYVASKGQVKPGIDELRDFLTKKLPDYMLPSAFVILEELPRTPAGKVDRDALPRPFDRTQSYVAPTTQIETVLCQIWCEALNLRNIGTRDNFFDLGGNQPLVIRVIGEISKTLNAHLSVAAFFQNPTIERLAQSLEQNKRVQGQSQVLQFQSGHIGPPLYFISAENNEFRLAQSIPSQHSIFAIEVPLPLAWREASANNRTGALPTMKQLVAPYVAALSAHAGKTSCVLAGFSFGGIMAFEAAHQFKKQGGKVEAVILLDASTTFSGSSPRRTRVQRLITYLNREFRSRSADRKLPTTRIRLRSSLASIYAIIWRGLRAGLKRIKPEPAKPPLETGILSTKVDEMGMPVYWSLLARLYANATSSYLLRRLDCRGVLLRTGEGAAGHWDLGWYGLFTKGLEIMRVPGDHLAIIRREKEMQVLAREISKLLYRFAGTERYDVASVSEGNHELGNTAHSQQATAIRITN